jgi:hypothetical protein
MEDDYRIRPYLILPCEIFTIQSLDGEEEVGSEMSEEGGG